MILQKATSPQWEASSQISILSERLTHIQYVTLAVKKNSLRQKSFCYKSVKHAKSS